MLACALACAPALAQEEAPGLGESVIAPEGGEVDVELGSEDAVEQGLGPDEVDLAGDPAVDDDLPEQDLAVGGSQGEAQDEASAVEGSGDDASLAEDAAAGEGSEEISAEGTVEQAEEPAVDEGLPEQELAGDEFWDEIPDSGWLGEDDPASGEPGAEVAVEQDLASDEVELAEEVLGEDIDGSGRLVEEVIVQAERRDASLQRTAVAVSAFSQRTLTENDISDITDLSGRVPGLIVSSQEDQSDIKIFIRGVGTNNPTETGDQGVGVYVDGIFAARAQGALALFYDLESVQVLRGPQGTLFGRNNTGGAMLLRTRRPSESIEGELQLTYGSYNRQQISGGISLPVTERWALRAAAHIDRDDGWVKNISADPRGQNHNFSGLSTGRFASVDTKLNNTDVRSARVTSLWTMGDRAYWMASFETFTDQGVHGIVLSPTVVNQGRYEAFIDSPVSLNLESNVWRSTFSIDMGEATNLEYLFGYASLFRTQVVDQDNGISQEFREARTEYQDTPSLSHELKLVGSVGGGVLDWAAGVYYFTEETGIRFDFDAQGGDLEGGATFIQPARGAVSWAVYSQMTYRPVDSLGLTLGVRYTDDLKYDRGGRNYNCPPSFIRPSLGGGNLGVFEDFFNNRTGTRIPDGIDDKTGLERLPNQCFATTINDLQKEDERTTWLARIDYNLSARHDHLLYASVGTGYRASVIQDAGNSTSPETSTSYEIGTKSDFGALRLNTATFFIDYEDLIRSGFDDELMRIVVGNVSAAEIFGAEAELTWLFGSGGRVDMSLSWLRAMYTDYSVDDVGVSTNNPAIIGADGKPSGLYDLTGNTMPNSPRFQMTFSFHWEFSFDNGSLLTPRLSVRAVDDLYFTDGNDNRAEIEYFANDTLTTGFLDGKPLTQPAHAKLDLGLNYLHEERWALDVFLNNVTNEMTLSSIAGGGTPQGFPGRYAPPFTWGMRFQIRFE